MRDIVRRAMSRHEPSILTVDGFPPAAVMILLYERDGEEVNIIGRVIWAARRL